MPTPHWSFFSSCGLCQYLLVTLDAIKLPKVKGNTSCAYLSSQDEAVPSFRKMLRQYVKSSGDIWSICGN